MCLGIPGEVVDVSADGERARVDLAGIVRQVNVGMLDSAVVPGDFVLVHCGFALEKLTPDEARDALGAFAESDPNNWLRAAEEAGT